MTLRYPLPGLAADIVRAAFGAVLMFVIVSQLEPDTIMFWIGTALGTVFALFGVLTGLRAATRIELESTSLTIRPGARTVRLDELRDFRLDYYSTRRDREAGWMQLTLRDGSGGVLKVDSRLERFGDLVERAATAAGQDRLPMDASTIENLKAIGHPDGAPPE